MAPLRHADFNVNASGKVLVGCSVWLIGWALRNESSSNPANIDIYDGADASGIPTFPITLAANESVRDLFPQDGVEMRNAVYINITSGQVGGSVVYQLPQQTVPVLRFGR
jgi:hypothetical protein